MTEQRKKENEQEKKTYTKPESYSKEISELIDMILKNHHRVLLSSDWHLWIKNKDGKGTHKRSKFNDVFKELSKADSEDMLIYLGDLCDGEFTNKEELRDALKGKLPKNSVMVIGNNDLFDSAFYKSCGFKYVTYNFVWNNIIFSHPPLEHNHAMNIHGHLHYNYKERKRDATYWVPYNNHVCVFNENGKLVELKDVMKSVKEYGTHVKVDEKQVQHLRDMCSKGIFEYAIASFMYDYKDPYGFDE